MAVPAFQYNGASIYPNNGSANTYNFPGSSGLFLCSIQLANNGAPSSTSQQNHGVTLTYKWTKTYRRHQDSVVWVPMGRTVAVSEFGTYNFGSLPVTYQVPPGLLGFGNETYESAFLGMQVDQARGWTIQIQSANGRGNAKYAGYGIGYNALYGTIQDLEIEDLEGGWQEFRFTFTESGS